MAWLDDFFRTAGVTFQLVKEALSVASSAVSFNSQKITNLGTPSASTDAATKGYTDAAVTFARIKAAFALADDGVTIAPIADITSSPASGVEVWANSGALKSRSPKDVREELSAESTSVAFPGQYLRRCGHGQTVDANTVTVISIAVPAHCSMTFRFELTGREAGTGAAPNSYILVQQIAVTSNATTVQPVGTTATILQANDAPLAGVVVTPSVIGLTASFAVTGVVGYMLDWNAWIVGPASK